MLSLQGAQEVFRELPVEYLDPQHLHRVAQRGGNKSCITAVYLCLSSIDIEVSRLAAVCPCIFRIMILCYGPRPKSG